MVPEDEREGGEMGLAGYGDSGSLQPQGLITRAQLATILVRIDNK